jgi:hypothetical protein
VTRALQAYGVHNHDREPEVRLAMLGRYYESAHDEIECASYANKRRTRLKTTKALNCLAHDGLQRLFYHQLWHSEVYNPS